VAVCLEGRLRLARLRWAGLCRCWGVRVCSQCALVLSIDRDDDCGLNPLHGGRNIIGAEIDRQWIVTSGFGLVHGFGFSFLLTQRLQFAGDHLLTSLLAFNVGVEIGQLLVLALALPVLALLFRHVVSERMGTIILSAFIAHTAWHWMTERSEALSQFPWPAVDAAFMAGADGGRWLL
jgi:HupE / UreJ protein